MLIFRRSYCIIAASGTVTLCKRPYSTPVESRLQSGVLYGLACNKSSCAWCKKLVYFIGNAAVCWFSQHRNVNQERSFGRTLLYHFQVEEISYSKPSVAFLYAIGIRLRLKCDGTRADNRFRLSAKRTSPFKSAGASVQSTTGRRGVRICGSNAGYTMFRGSVENSGYTLHSPVCPSRPLPCVTVCHHISTGLYLERYTQTDTANIGR